jgi:hypothetical protein
MLWPTPAAIRSDRYQTVKLASFAKIFEQNVDRRPKLEQELSWG